MKKFREKLLNMAFGPLVKRLFIVTICFILLGGGLSVVLLQPQIAQALSIDRTLGADEQTGSDKTWCFQDRHDHGDAESDHPFWSISEPGTAAKIGLAAFGCGLLLLLALWWLMIPAWLYQASAQAGMNTALWPFLGVLSWGGALFLFLIIRAFLRQKCSQCGAWQRKGAYCRLCGEKLHVTCPSCGTDCKIGDLYCNYCGVSLIHGSDADKNHEIR